MSESKNHIELVELTVAYIKKMLPADFSALIQYDSANSVRPTKAIKNYIPDVYFWNNDLLIIGEAKTIDDFDRKHSTEQFTAYINECGHFYGKSILVVSVPWQMIPNAKNSLRRLRKELACENVEIHIINDLGIGVKI